MTESERHLTTLINNTQPRLDAAAAELAAARAEAAGLMYDLDDEGTPASPEVLAEARAAVRKARAHLLELQQELTGYQRRLREVQATLDIK